MAEIPPPATPAGAIPAAQPALNNDDSLHGLRVCSFESRKGNEMRALLEKQGAVVTIAPSMREIPLGDNPAALAFGQELLQQRLDLLILLTGVGTRALIDVLETRHSREELLEALRKTTILVRGPKPAAVLREWKVPFAYHVPEPNTWRELLAMLDAQVPIAGKRLAVQEYGKPNPELYAGLRERGADVLAVPVYRWALPEDCGPLEQAVRDTLAGRFDVLMFTSAHQWHNVTAIAERIGYHHEWLPAVNRCVVASIGPTASETLTDAGVTVDIEPEHPKMGHLVMTTSRAARGLLARKRADG